MRLRHSALLVPTRSRNWSNLHVHAGTTPDGTPVVRLDLRSSGLRIDLTHEAATELADALIDAVETTPMPPAPGATSTDIHEKDTP